MMGVTKGEARNVDYSSYDVFVFLLLSSMAPSPNLPLHVSTC